MARPKVKMSVVDKKLTRVSQRRSRPLSPRQVDAAAGLGVTVSGTPKTKGKGKDGPIGPGDAPLPVGFQRKPDGSLKTPNEVMAEYPQVTQAQIDAYGRLYEANAKLNQPAARIYSAANDTVDAYKDMLSEVPAALRGEPGAMDELNHLAEFGNQRIADLKQAAMDAILGNHTSSQARVGGTKGSTTVVDRSAAVRKAWLTRRQLYGSSGRKDS